MTRKKQSKRGSAEFVFVLVIDFVLQEWHKAGKVARTLYLPGFVFVFLIALLHTNDTKREHCIVCVHLVRERKKEKEVAWIFLFLFLLCLSSSRMTRGKGGSKGIVFTWVHLIRPSTGTCLTQFWSALKERLEVKHNIITRFFGEKSKLW